MRLDAAFPDIVNRTYAIVKPSFPLITVLYLLRIQELAAVPLASEGKDGCSVVFGFSSLERLIEIGAKRFASLLQRPCGYASKRIDCLSADQDLGELLDSFEAQNLGVAAVREDSSTRRSLVTLADVIELYERGSIRSDMVVEDVASPIFAMSGETSVRDAVQAMFEHRCRRIFVCGEEGYITERSVINYILSPWALVDYGREGQKDPLNAPIGKLMRVAPVSVSPRLGLREGALKLGEQKSGCLVLRGEEKVVTPWDLTLKPWTSGGLVVSRPRSDSSTPRHH